MPEGRPSFRARLGGFVADRARFTRPQIVGALLLGIVVVALVLLSRWSR